jgi:hypothetical protein
MAEDKGEDGGDRTSLPRLPPGAPKGQAVGAVVYLVICRETEKVRKKRRGGEGGKRPLYQSHYVRFELFQECEHH